MSIYFTAIVEFVVSLCLVCLCLQESVYDLGYCFFFIQRLKMEELEELSSGVEGRLETSENTHREALTQCYHNTAVMQDNCSRLISLSLLYKHAYLNVPGDTCSHAYTIFMML